MSEGPIPAQSSGLEVGITGNVFHGPAPIQGSGVQNNYFYASDGSPSVREPQVEGDHKVQSLARDADPEDLGVHRMIRFAEPSASIDRKAGYKNLTPYLAREHDVRLREYLAPAVRAETSVFALLLGESAIGKTRALYEAIMALAPTHVLLHPVDSEDLQELLDNGAIVPGTVLWLNETQRYFLGEVGAAIAKRLARTLSASPGVIIVGAMWRDPYFKDLRSKVLTPEGGPIEDLLQHRHTVVLDVRDQLTKAESLALRALAVDQSDERVIEALDASEADGRVIQHLSGGPELLASYLLSGGPELATAFRERGSHASADHAETFFTPVEQALITAALDARRLGHQQPIPAALLAEAADGYLSPAQRPTDPSWAATTLRNLVRGYRGSDIQDRTDVRRCLTAITTHSTRSGSPASYEPADYLEQHTYVVLYDHLGPPSLWNALIRHASNPADLERLAESARRRGLIKASVGLLRKAVLAGSPVAASKLIELLRTASLDPDLNASAWVVDKITMSHSSGVGDLLGQLNHYGPDEAKLALLSRHPAESANLSDADGIGALVDALMRAGANEELQALLDRGLSEHVEIADSYDLLRLLVALNRAGAKETARGLSARIALHIEINRRPALGSILSQMAKVGARQAAQTLLERVSRDIEIVDLAEVQTVLSYMRDLGMRSAWDFLVARVADHANIGDYRIGDLVDFLSRNKANTALERLAARTVENIETIPLSSTSVLMSTLIKCGEVETARMLAMRSVQAADLSDANGVSRMLKELRKAGASEAWAIDASGKLMARAVACLDFNGDFLGLSAFLIDGGDSDTLRTLAVRASDDIQATSAQTIAYLLWALRETSLEESWAEKVIRTLASRAAAHVELQDVYGIVALLSEMDRVHMRDAVQTLASRAAAHAALTEAYPVSTLASTLMKIGQNSAIQTLLTRQLIEQVDLSSPRAIGELLTALGGVEAHEAKKALGARAAAHLQTFDAEGVYELCWKLDGADSDILSRRAMDSGSFGGSDWELGRWGRWGHGREMDGTYASPWLWSDLHFPA